MKKKTKIILGLTIIVVVIGIISLWPEKKTKYKDERVIIPERTVTNYKSDTGAKEISLSEEQYDEVYLIKDLRNKTPIERNYFSIKFDYSINKFVVKYKGESKGKNEFNQWLEDTGYNKISSKYFLFQ